MRIGRREQLSSSVSTESVALLLKTIFYGVPLATRLEGVHTVHRAYQEVLAVLLASLKQEEGSKTHEEDTERRAGVE